MPSKPKTKSKKGKAGTPSPKNQPRKAARWAQARAAGQEPYLMVTEKQFMDYGVLPDPLHGMASCLHLDTMIAMIMEFSQKVHGQDEGFKSQRVPPTQVF